MQSKKVVGVSLARKNRKYYLLYRIGFSKGSLFTALLETLASHLQRPLTRGSNLLSGLEFLGFYKMGGLALLQSQLNMF